MSNPKEWLQKKQVQAYLKSLEEYWGDKFEDFNSEDFSDLVRYVDKKIPEAFPEETLIEKVDRFIQTFYGKEKYFSISLDVLGEEKSITFKFTWT